METSSLPTVAMSDASDAMVRLILDDAKQAPSVHNTQPWTVTRTGDGLTVGLDKRHALSDGDPTGRETIISLGIFCEAIAVAAASHGWQTAGMSLSAETVHIGLVSLQSVTLSVPPETERLAAALRTRCSDRSIYRPATIAPEVMQSIRDCFTGSESTTIHATDDAGAIATVADLTGKAIGVALSSPAFRSELADYLIRRGSPKRRGIHVDSLHINPLLAALEPTSLRLGIGIGKEAALERRRWQSASALVIITADGDMPKYWFETGRAYLRASLAIELAGLAQATSAAIVEASNYHDDIEELLGTKQRILAVIRIGRGSLKKVYSPRITTDELLKA